MPYDLFSDLTVVVHFLWILFLVFGFIFVLKRSSIAWVHLGGILFSLVINFLGLYCPLTYLENFFRHLHGGHSSYGGSFIIHYMELIIYPDVPIMVIRVGEILFACINLVGYLFVGMRIVQRRRGGPSFGR
ncbi:MAG: DUF2784 domain-containing protein [Thermodesulfobacteriota bacterium]|jgi:hypothetical protein|nr:DUF2784 domain-containing protein [Thermodesulfobacteriota bacterium]